MDSIPYTNAPSRIGARTRPTSLENSHAKALRRPKARLSTNRDGLYHHTAFLLSIIFPRRQTRNSVISYEHIPTPRRDPNRGAGHIIFHNAGTY